MNREEWTYIVTQAIEGNEMPFNQAVAKRYEQHFEQAIQKYTLDHSLSKEVYIVSMTKFWERFVLKGEDLPTSNVEGYIFQMSRNAFYAIKRKQNSVQNSMTTSMSSQDIVKRYSDALLTSGNINKIDVGQEANEITILHEAILQLDPICQQLIQANVMEGKSLKELQKPLGITGTYNAIVQKKKRCMNMLTKRYHQVLKKTNRTLIAVSYEI